MRFVNQVHQAIHALIEAGYKEVACWVLDKMLDDFPGHGTAHHDRAVLAYDDGDLDKACRHYELAAESEPENTAILKSLAHFYHVALGHTEKALEQYKKVLASDPGDTEALMIAGHLSVGVNRLDQARQFYARLLEIEPWHSDIRDNLEKIDTKARKNISSKSAEEYYRSGLDMAQAGDRAGAIELLQHAVEKEPHHALAHNDLGVLYYQTGDKEKALRHYEQAAALDPGDPVFQKNLGDFHYIERGDIQAALERYVRVLNMYPEDVEALMNIGHICMALGQNEDARVFFNRILELDPFNDDARKLIDRIDPPWTGEQASPRDGNALYPEAQALSAQGNITGAIAVLESLVSMEPGNAAALNDLGVLHYQVGNKDQALQYYEKAARSEPNHNIFQKNLADFYLMELGRIEDAMKIYVQVLENDPLDVESLIATGVVCSKMNNLSDARSFFERALQIEPWNIDAQQALKQLENNENAWAV
jgi:Flp pilus assembly protein TadD